MQIPATSFSESTATPAPTDTGLQARSVYTQLLDWCFALFNSIRLLTYLPTMLAIQQSGSSSQHSLLTWLVWAAANGSMAAMLYEHNGRRLNKLVGVNLGNAVQCAATCILVACYR